MFMQFNCSYLANHSQDNISLCSLQAAGNEVEPGQFLRFIFVHGTERVRVWELGVDARTVDTKRYCAMLDRAMAGLMVGFEKNRS
jgi:hypothetical protein